MRRSIAIFAMLASVGALIFLLVLLAAPAFNNMVLVDFTSTFYPAANYLVRGENVYLNDYTYPPDGTQHPPYNPIWILYVAVPLSMYPLGIANPVRFLIDLASLPLLAFFCSRWTHLHSVWRSGLLAIAPWFSIMLYSGQWAGLAVLGTLLCFWGASSINATVLAVGILLAAARPNFTLPIILAALIYAWRNRIFLKTALRSIILVAVFSIAQPGWIMDLLTLYYDRFVHPRPADSILLLPGWPWAQFALLGLGTLFMVIHVAKSRESQPSRWLWAIMICIGLVSALHEYTYDWVILMLPLAWLLKDRRAIFLVGALYAYTFVWAFLKVTIEVSIPSPIIIPSVILLAVLTWPFLPMGRQVRYGG
jgi:hypothetical protein